MNTKIDRAIKHANMYIEQGLTVREISGITGVCKSTVHRDIHRVITKVSPELSVSVREKTMENKRKGYINGAKAMWEVINSRKGE